MGRCCACPRSYDDDTEDLYDDAEESCQPLDSRRGGEYLLLPPLPALLNSFEQLHWPIVLALPFPPMDLPQRMAALSLQERENAEQASEAGTGTGTITPVAEMAAPLPASCRNDDAVGVKTPQPRTARGKRPKGLGLASSRWAHGGSCRYPPTAPPSPPPKVPRGGLAKSFWAPGNASQDSQDEGEKTAE